MNNTLKSQRPARPEQWETLPTNKTEFIVQVTAPNGQDLGTLDFDQKELLSLLRQFGFNGLLNKGLRKDALQNSYYATRQRYQDLVDSYHRQKKQLYALIDSIKKSSEQVDKYELHAETEALNNWYGKQKEELDEELEERERLEAEELLEEGN